MNGFQLIPTSGKLEIKAEFATLESSRRVLLIGESPSDNDLREGKHFTGSMNELLWKPLGSIGLVRAAVSMTYLTEHAALLTQGNWNDVARPNFARLRAVLEHAQPNVVVLVGPQAFRLAKSNFKEAKLSDWRGSIFICDEGDSPLYGYKCIGILAPYQLAKDWSNWPIYRLDLSRIAKQAEFPELRLVERNFEPTISADEATRRLDWMSTMPDKITLDIEGGINGITCISFTNKSTWAFCINLELYTDAELMLVLPALARFLISSTPKVLQNSLYDNFMLSWVLKCPIANVFEDTMLSGWEIYPELPKGLGTQLSIWTDMPFYKTERTNNDRVVYYTYCCKDSAGTHELMERHNGVLAKNQSGYLHYRENVALLTPFLYMELRGIRYNTGLGHVELTQVEQTLTLHQQRINEVASKVTGVPTIVNPRSPEQLKNLLYKQLHYPVQTKDVTVDGVKIKRDSTDVDSLLALKTLYNGPNDAILDHILANRKYEEIRKQLSTGTDADGRVRCSYNIVGTDTGRLTCYGSPTGSGGNLQTITKKLRHLYCADPGYWLFQCDLSGADGWTVAAHCARLGDRTMLDDYLYGLKPAKIIALLYNHGPSVNQWSRERLKEASENITEEGPEGWLYFACKRVQHGSNYGLGRKRMSLQILKDSYKLLGRAIVVSQQDCAKLQTLYLDHRYVGVKRWQQYIKDIIQTNPVLPSASGHTRRFFGRREDHQTYTAALSHEPQANTTFATNRALFRLWADVENREGNGLIIQPLHQVHDALIGQFPKDRTEWACGKIREYFNNPITIAGMTINIPFGGAYGPSWGEQPYKL